MGNEKEEAFLCYAELVRLRVMEIWRTHSMCKWGVSCLFLITKAVLPLDCGSVPVYEQCIRTVLMTRSVSGWDREQLTMRNDIFLSSLSCQWSEQPAELSRQWCLFHRAVLFGTICSQGPTDANGDSAINTLMWRKGPREIWLFPLWCPWTPRSSFLCLNARHPQKYLERT